MEKPTLLDFFKWTIALTEHYLALFKRIVTAVESGNQSGPRLEREVKKQPAKIGAAALKEKIAERSKAESDANETRWLYGLAVSKWICPDCGGHLVDKTSFFRKHIMEQNLLKCSGCDSVHKQKILYCEW